MLKRELLVQFKEIIVGACANLIMKVSIQCKKTYRLCNHCIT